MRNVATTRPGSRPAGGLTGRRVAAAAIATGLLASGAAACSSAGSGSAASSGSTAGSTAPASPAASGSTSVSTVDVSNVTLNIGDQAGSGSQALLTAAGLISKLPFKAHWADFTSGPPMLQAMGAGSVDVGGVGDAPPVFAAAGGSQIAVVSALAGDPAASAILVPANSPIHSVAQLRGKSIAVAQGSSADYHLLAILTRAGLRIKDVTPDYLQPAEAQAAFAAGHVAAWDVWSPFIEQAEAQDHARVLADGASIGQTYGFQVASRAALANPSKAAAIHDYLALLDQAYAWAATHQSAWAATWAKATGLPLSVMTQAVKDDQPRPAGITAPVLGAEQSVANAFAAAGLIPGHVEFKNFAVTSFNSIFGASS
jgi:sulfonate transport system substrate-binding protein